MAQGDVVGCIWYRYFIFIMYTVYSIQQFEFQFVFEIVLTMI